MNIFYLKSAVQNMMDAEAFIWVHNQTLNLTNDSNISEYHNEMKMNQSGRVNES